MNKYNWMSLVSINTKKRKQIKNSDDNDDDNEEEQTTPSITPIIQKSIGTKM